jgi:Ca-activated chloride channel family protein
MPTEQEQLMPSQLQATSSQQPQSAPQKKSMSKDENERDASQASEGQKNQKGSAAPKGSLTAADRKAGQPNQQGKELVSEAEFAPDGAMTMQEAEKMLQAIRDQEMIRRLRRQAAERNQHIPVDRDW